MRNKFNNLEDLKTYIFKLEKDKEALTVFIYQDEKEKLFPNRNSLGVVQVFTGNLFSMKERWVNLVEVPMTYEKAQENTFNEELSFEKFLELEFKGLLHQIFEEEQLKKQAISSTKFPNKEITEIDNLREFIDSKKEEKSELERLKEIPSESYFMGADPVSTTCPGECICETYDESGNMMERFNWKEFLKEHRKTPLQFMDNPNQGIKETDDKLFYEIDWDFITAIAERMAINKGDKYPRWNWKKEIDKESLKQALTRHFIEVMKGNYSDEQENGHLIALATNAMMIIEQLKLENE